MRWYYVLDTVEALPQVSRVRSPKQGLHATAEAALSCSSAVMRVIEDAKVARTGAFHES
jgi:hypothetical protein